MALTFHFSDDNIFISVCSKVIVWMLCSWWQNPIGKAS